MEKLINAMIEEVFNNCIQDDWYVDFASTRKASELTESLYWNKAEFNDIRFELESAILQEHLASERQGFIYGFRKAMEMFKKGEM